MVSITTIIIRLRWQKLTPIGMRFGNRSSSLRNESFWRPRKGPRSILKWPGDAGDITDDPLNDGASIGHGAWIDRITSIVSWDRVRRQQWKSGLTKSSSARWGQSLSLNMLPHCDELPGRVMRTVTLLIIEFFPKFGMRLFRFNGFSSDCSHLSKKEATRVDEKKVVLLPLLVFHEGMSSSVPPESFALEIP
jgi:hypothetical protein